jgi:hypothetical protein
VAIWSSERAGVLQFVSFQLTCDAVDGGDFEHLIVIHLPLFHIHHRFQIIATEPDIRDEFFTV